MIPLFFKKGRIPAKLPKEMEDEVKKLKKTKSKLECLREAFNFVSKRLVRKKHQAILKYPRLFVTNVYNLWEFTKKDKILHCCQMNYLLRILLIKSGKFKEREIGLVNCIHVCFMYHQYMKIKINHDWVNVDLWFHPYGVPLGKHKRVLIRIWPTIY